VDLQLLDVTRGELQQENAADGLAAIERLLSNEEAEEAAGTVIVAAFTFGPDEKDVALLERLGRIAGQLGGCVLGAGDPALVGCRSFGEGQDSVTWQTLDGEAALRWRRLRQSESATRIGLAMPQILLRLPYGKRTDPVDVFDFEELSASRAHETYLWGNPAFACARLVASSFAEHGATMEPGDHLELDDLPAAVYEDDEGPKLKPCAEAALGETAAQRILAVGVMPLLASSRRNAVRIMRWQAIADPPAPLAVRR
jgi:type VI secretion system protein ImpC